MILNIYKSLRKSDTYRFGYLEGPCRLCDRAPVAGGSQYAESSNLGHLFDQYAESRNLGHIFLTFPVSCRHRNQECHPVYNPFSTLHDLS